MSSTRSLRLLSSNLQKTAPSYSRPVAFGTRNVHHRRRALLFDQKNGVGKFMPPAALQTSLEWQEGLLERLNDEVKGTPQANKSVVQTVIDTCTKREQTLAFNYASLALNNSFFLDNIKPPPAHEPNHEAEISSALAAAINEQHGSLRQLKSSFSAAALGMFSNGWVWFVSDSAGQTGILPTFGPGTLLVRSRTYMAAVPTLALGEEHQSAPTATPTATSTPPPPGTSPALLSSGASSAPGQRPPVETGVRHYSHFNIDTPRASIHGSPASSGDHVQSHLLNVGQVLYPLFCVPVYEHAWMSAGYGVWGKEQWLKEFWTAVDWSKVSQSYKYAMDTKSYIQKP